MCVRTHKHKFIDSSNFLRRLRCSYTTGLAKRVGHGLRECQESLRSNWRNNWMGGALALTPSLSLSSRKPAFLPSSSATGFRSSIGHLMSSIDTGAAASQGG